MRVFPVTFFFKVSRSLTTLMILRKAEKTLTKVWDDFKERETIFLRKIIIKQPVKEKMPFYADLCNAVRRRNLLEQITLASLNSIVTRPFHQNQVTKNIVRHLGYYTRPSF